MLNKLFEGGKEKICEESLIFIQGVVCIPKAGAHTW